MQEVRIRLFTLGDSGVEKPRLKLTAFLKLPGVQASSLPPVRQRGLFDNSNNPVVCQQSLS